MVVHLAELERLTDFARAITASLSDVWSAAAGATVRIGSPQAEEIRAQELTGTLEGWFWVLPVEVTGVCGGALAILLDLSLVGGDGGGGAEPGGTGSSLAGAIDGFLAGAADRLTAAMGGPVSLDRMGLREVPGEQAAVILGEFLGQGGLVAVSFAAEIAASASAGGSDPGGAAGGARKGEVAVIFGTVLAREVGGARAPAGKTLILERHTMEGASSRAEGAREQASRPGQAAPGERLPAAAAPDVSAPAVPAPALPAAGDPTESGTLRRAKARAAKASPGAPPAPGAGESAPRGRRSRGRAAPRRDSPGARARPRSGRGLPADGMALLERVRGLTLRLSADVASRTLTVGELLAVRPGSVIDLAKAVTEPLELRAAGRLVALGDAVSLPGGPAGRGSLPAGGSPRGGFGLKVRGG